MTSDCDQSILHCQSSSMTLFLMPSLPVHFTTSLSTGFVFFVNVLMTTEVTDLFSIHYKTEKIRNESIEAGRTLYNMIHAVWVIFGSRNACRTWAETRAKNHQTNQTWLVVTTTLWNQEDIGSKPRSSRLQRFHSLASSPCQHLLLCFGFLEQSYVTIHSDDTSLWSVLLSTKLTCLFSN